MAGAKQTPGTQNDGICPSKKRKRTASVLQGGTLMSDEYSQPTNLMKVRTSTCICSLGFQFKLPAPHSSYLRQKWSPFSCNRFFATPRTYCVLVWTSLNWSCLGCFCLLDLDFCFFSKVVESFSYYYYSFFFFTVGPCWLSILKRAMYTYQSQTP